MYVISAIQYDFKQFSDDKHLRTRIFIGYFTNLKKAYNQLNGKKILSYSTIARKMKQDKVVMILNVNLVINGILIKVKKVTIRHLLFNEFYEMHNYVDIESLLVAELNKNNLESFVQIQRKP